MNLLRLIISVSTLLFSLSNYADDFKQNAQSFQSICSDTWMKKSSDVKDKVAYKNFGEKYCGCAAKQALDNDAAIKQAVRLCMSRTILHDAMDSLEDSVGLSKAHDNDLVSYCQDKWALIYPKQTEEEKKTTTAYCECATPKLMDIVKRADNITDKEYDEEIDKVASACSGNALATKPTARR